MGNSAIWSCSTVLPSDASVRLMSGASPSTVTDVVDARNLELNVDGRGRFDNERDFRRRIGRETLRRCLQPIVARRHVQELVQSRPVAGGRPLQPCGRVGQSNLRAGNSRARRVRNAAIQLAGGLRYRQRGQQRQHREHPNRAPRSLHTSNAKLVPPLVLPAARLADGFASST